MDAKNTPQGVIIASEFTHQTGETGENQSERNRTKQVAEQESADHQRKEDFGAFAPVGPGEIDALQDLLEDLGVDFHPRNAGGDRRRTGPWRRSAGM